MSRPGVGILARLALILGGVGGVLLTPPFALSFFLSYGAGEQSRAWLTRLRAPLLDAGLLVVGSESRYDAYGLLYLAAWGLALAGLVVLVRRHWAGWPSRLRRAGGWWCSASVPSRWGSWVTTDRRATSSARWASCSRCSGS